MAAPVTSAERAPSPVEELSQTSPAGTVETAQQDSLWGAHTADMEEDLEPEDDEDEPT